MAQQLDWKSISEACSCPKFWAIPVNFTFGVTEPMRQSTRAPAGADRPTDEVEGCELEQQQRCGGPEEPAHQRALALAMQR